jgi:hypothetical protein
MVSRMFELCISNNKQKDSLEYSVLKSLKQIKIETMKIKRVDFFVRFGGCILKFLGPLKLSFARWVTNTYILKIYNTIYDLASVSCIKYI